MSGTVVNLIIKAPNQQIKDQEIKCNLGWSIGRLKEYLSEVYPSKPKSSHQKLIYSGQLLNDSAQLKDVLRQCDDSEDQSYIVHLVCTPQKVRTGKTTRDENQATESQTTDNATSTGRNVRATRTNNSQNQREENVGNVNAQQTYSQQTYSPEQYLDPENRQQLAWMQQAYTHYFTQYMQLMAAQGIQLQASVPYPQQTYTNGNDTISNTYVNNSNNNNNNNNNVGEEQAQAAVQDAADINGAGNNNGAGEEAAFNRDWLDFFYTLSRIVVLFGIVYFYSSPLRFLIVTFLGFAIYLYQGGFFRVQPILLGDNNNGRVENNNQVLQNEAIAPQGAQQQNAQAPIVQPEARTNANEENEEQRPGALAFTWTFFSSFIASLIPDQPNVI